MTGALMIFLSFFLLLFSPAFAVELQLESSFVDNPDKIFRPASRSTFLLAPSLEHKLKTKHAGFFFLVRSKLEYKHDTDADRLRDGEASSTVLAIKPLGLTLIGASLSAGHLWRWRRDFNVISDRYLEIDGDHFFAETRFFGEKKLSTNWGIDGGITGRVEDYASSYSVYVNQQNDNISGAAYASLVYKASGVELKPTASYQRKLWRERRALSRDGFFVAPGEELKPDRIDTLTGAVKGIVSFEKFTVSLTPSWTRINDLNNDGRSWSGPGIGSEVVYPVKTYSAKLRADWSKRDYDTQLSSFQSAGNKGLIEESASYSALGSGKIGDVTVELMHGLERLTSNQTDVKGREIGKVRSSITTLSLKKQF